VRVLAFCAACALFAAGSLAADESVVHTIVMDGTAFSPDTVTVKRGDIAVWVNKDPFPHTVTRWTARSIRSRSTQARAGSTSRKSPGSIDTLHVSSTMKAALKE
jgi:plastocyanin